MSKIAGSNLVVMWTLNEIGNIANIVFHKIFSFHTYSFGNGDYIEIIEETEEKFKK